MTVRLGVGTTVCIEMQRWLEDKDKKRSSVDKYKHTTVAVDTYEHTRRTRTSAREWNGESGRSGGPGLWSILLSMAPVQRSSSFQVSSNSVPSAVLPASDVPFRPATLNYKLMPS